MDYAEHILLPFVQNANANGRLIKATVAFKTARVTRFIDKRLISG